MVKTICLLAAFSVACGSSGEKAESPLDAGTPLTDAAQMPSKTVTLSPDGGLVFAVFGDARPPTVNATTGYPTAIVQGIFSQAQTLGAEFMIGTGDYMYASKSAGVNAQVPQYQQAVANFKEPIYLAMGNHECNGYTDSNCPLGNETPNVRAFLQLLPTGVTTPYYRVDVTTPSGAAKFIFVAANAWSDTQSAWLKTQLADSTVYTFVVRHEPSYETTAPGVTPSEAIINAAPYTVQFLGHEHEYKRIDVQHVISGNGGAPLGSTSDNFGFMLIQQQSDGTIALSEIDEATMQVTDSFRITAAGAAVN